ncbi:unnamed protein product [Urochloa humidicola]
MARRRRPFLICPATPHREAHNCETPFPHGEVKDAPSWDLALAVRSPSASAACLEWAAPAPCGCEPGGGSGHLPVLVHRVPLGSSLYLVERLPEGGGGPVASSAALALSTPVSTPALLA